MTGNDWIALAGIAAGAAGTIGGLVFAHVGRKAEHLHARELSRSERLHAQRQDAYVQLGAFLERTRLWAFRTEPFIGPQAEPPEAIGDEELARLSGLIAVAGSPHVQSMLQEVTKHMHDFEIALASYRTDRVERMPNARREMDDARKGALDSLTSAEEAMRDELATL